ncbi:aldehyde dehydrogenase [Elioraea tepida]|uniref:Aldehyde dehydrogenase n=1 Tax=Elioraea tepida TaxID=2843330 RepID=A0A975YKI2_9PROT|nr:thiamine pyrophosphate-dependent enzyme [Elioraea tepida]QXM25751.1 aldehyde dehydrogenase [Elioraea tepida]
MSATVMQRRPAVRALLADRPADLLVIAGLGTPAYDLFDAGDHDGNFYLWGAMGGAAMVGLGLALARPANPVLVLTGDGEALMGLGALATIGARKPSNLSIAVLDNGHFGETGMQRSHTSLGTDLTAVAAACGFAWTATAATVEEARALAPRLADRSGPALIRLVVGAEPLPKTLPPRDGAYLKTRFRANLGLAPA